MEKRKRERRLQRRKRESKRKREKVRRIEREKALLLFYFSLKRKGNFDNASVSEK